MIVEYFNNFCGVHSAMATVNFSVPEHVKNVFNHVFEGRNKSAIIAELMAEAVVREEQRLQSNQAIDRILKRQKSAPKVSSSEVSRARHQGRP
jgi:hypothetical protein